MSDDHDGATPVIDAERRTSQLRLAGRHHRFGWWALALFAAVGLVLESLQGFRTPWYLDADVETRRTMFRLAHAHGALLALVNLAFAAALKSGLLARLETAPRVSKLMLLGSLAVPGGFATGGVWFFESDPGLGIVLVPIGAVALLVSVLAIARAS